MPSDLVDENVPQSPVSILRQQANALSAKLNNRILAKVVSQSTLVPSPRVRHRLVLVVPSLENYQLDLLGFSQNEEIYPVVAQLRAEEPATLENEQAFIDWLRRAFASTTTRRTLSSLLSLVQ